MKQDALPLHGHGKKSQTPIEVHSRLPSDMAICRLPSLPHPLSGTYFPNGLPALLASETSRWWKTSATPVLASALFDRDSRMGRLQLFACQEAFSRLHSAGCIGEHAMHDDFYGFFRQAHVCELCSLFRGHADAHEPACRADGYAHAPDWRTAIAHNLTGRSPSLYPS